MSIAFRKKDYHYDGDDLYDDDVLLSRGGDDEEEDERYRNHAAHHKATAVPSEWVMLLYEEMKNISMFHAVEIFDKLDPMSFAEFVASHIDTEESNSIFI